MPELPEVETVRRTLAAVLVGRTVGRVRVTRADVVRGSAAPAALMAGRSVTAIHRHGKQLAIVAGESADDGPAIGVHLGMSGSMRYHGRETNGNGVAHVHVAWLLDDGGRVEFRDPRRFGGLWTYPTFTELRERRWAALGPDALSVAPRRLHAALARTSRAIKAALLDQQVVAGLGNIYVDELLHAAGVHPLTPANNLALPQIQSLVRRMRTLLNRAIDAGGSTLRDYVDGAGQPGGFQLRHRVYGRGGQSCRRCRGPLDQAVIAGRTTTFCPACQRTNNEIKKASRLSRMS